MEIRQIGGILVMCVIRVNI